MSGHSKWATTKHKKAALDAKRAKAFAKYIKVIEVAARLGGSDLDGNPALYDAVQKAKKNSVPLDNITRAIKRGSGESNDAKEYISIIYEAYGPGGVALLIESLTDNKNRAASDIRNILSKNGATMADPGSVSYNFERKAVFEITKTEEITEDYLLEILIENDIDELEEQGDKFVITAKAEALSDIRTALKAAGIEYDSADTPFVAGVKVDVDLNIAKKLYNLFDALEDSDDVQNIFANCNISPEIEKQLIEEE